VKVISQPDPQFGQAGDNPLSVLGQALFPPGSTNAPMEQLQQFYRLGVQAMSKAQSAGGETRSNSMPISTGMSALRLHPHCAAVISSNAVSTLSVMKTAVIWHLLLC